MLSSFERWLLKNSKAGHLSKSQVNKNVEEFSSTKFMETRFLQIVITYFYGFLFALLENLRL